MSNFYSQVKTADKHLDFVFITGCTKFARMGVFSSLNNLVDISLDPEFGVFMGITHEELLSNFSSFISITAQILNTSEENLIEEIKDYYDGFSFDGITKLYNPFSTLGFFNKHKFDNFWIETASNSFFRDFIKDKGLTPDDFTNLRISRSSASNPSEIDKISPAGFLYQSGYLTLRKIDDNFYDLVYPNTEVRNAIGKLFLDYYFKSDIASDNAASNLKDDLIKGNISEIITKFNNLYSAISYDDYTMAEKKDYAEGYYRTILYIFLKCSIEHVFSEVHGNLGRADIIAFAEPHTYVFELKLTKDSAKVLAAARTGFAQIEDKNYAGPYPDAIKISLAIDAEKRQIGYCVYEKDGQKHELDLNNSIAETTEVDISIPPKRRLRM
jgi:hypothetical protein